MLKTVWLTNNTDISKGTAMLLGGFDGLHVGHRKLLQCAKNSGLPVGVMTIVGAKEQGIFTFAEREEIFAESGVDFVFELPFAEIKDLSPTAFLQLLKKEFSPALFVCGEDFRFGMQASGDVESLKRDGQVRVEVLSLVEVDGEKVSSRTVKAHLSRGEMERANVLLGAPFFLVGEVVKDRQIGRTMGFPTANVLYPIDKFPLQQGVYETEISIAGKVYRGITNYGARPTFDNEKVLTETYVDQFNADLYGAKIKIAFIRKLRDVKKFHTIGELKMQLTEDIRRVREHD